MTAADAWKQAIADVVVILAGKPVPLILPPLRSVPTEDEE